ncbi:MAG: hypothetical protein ABJD07_08400, partial [Gemmatimonadaceae bacterium]
ERLVGGGAITVLPEGLDVEVMKTGGVGGLFFSIDRARFIYRQLLAAPRLEPLVASVAPQIDGKLLYLRAAGREIPVRATGEIPSRSAGVGVPASLAAGAWSDDEGDRAWIAPAPRQLYGEIDRFHRPPADAEHRESWGEWHYFNVISDDRHRWAFISYIVAGDVGSGDGASGAWGGQLAVTLREEAGPHGARTRKFVASAPAAGTRFSTTDADVTIGASSVTLLDDGRYAVRGTAREEHGSATVALDLIVSPAPRQYFPGSSLSSGSFVSGYTVPGLRANASGTLCVTGAPCEAYRGAQSYHDHNWGVWRGVTWEWGAVRAGSFSVLYGRVRSPDGSSNAAPIFLYLVDSLGFRALFRPRTIDYTDARTIRVGAAVVRVPATAVMQDVRGNDSLRVDLMVEDAIGTDTRRPLVERGDLSAARTIRTPYFIQMQGRARITGRVGGAPIRGEGTGFFETYR